MYLNISVKSLFHQQPFLHRRECRLGRNQKTMRFMQHGFRESSDWTGEQNLPRHTPSNKKQHTNPQKTVYTEVKKIRKKVKEEK